ncbi:MAG: hypothetical protein AAF408_00135 [Pseudomonadota bacterium]
MDWPGAIFAMIWGGIAWFSAIKIIISCRYIPGTHGPAFRLAQPFQIAAVIGYCSWALLLDDSDPEFGQYVTEWIMMWAFLGLASFVIAAVIAIPLQVWLKDRH